MRSFRHTFFFLGTLALPVACGGQDGDPSSGSNSPGDGDGDVIGDGDGETGAGGTMIGDGDTGGVSTGTGGNSGTGGAPSGGAGAGDGGAGDGGTGGVFGDGGAVGTGGSPPVVLPTRVDCDVVSSGDAEAVSLNGNDIQADNQNGLTFKGFGVLSANGTSALLMDYKSQQPAAYAQLLKVLFGGESPIMTHVKIEMGNDRNNSTGPDPATMRLQNEPANVARSPGFQLAADAKKVNPSLKVSILRWHAPGWVGTDNNRIYTWFKDTILAAYRTYGHMVDYVNPGENERGPNLAFTKDFASRVSSDSTGFDDATEQALFNSIKTVISDEVGVGSFGGTMVSDASLRSAVSVAAYHYNTDDDASGNFKRLADEFDVEVWNSEAQATFSNSAFRPNNNATDPTVAGTGIGGTGSALEMANTIIKGFVNSRRSHFIYQPAIGSFYEGGQYSHKELISARDPWSGFIHFDAGLDILRHLSSFAVLGFEDEANSSGIWRAVPQASRTTATGTNPVVGRNGNPNYITLASPDKNDFSTVIINDSEQTKTYELSTSNMAFADDPDLEIWETRARDDGAFNENYLKYQCHLAAEDGGVYRFQVKPFSAVTVSTLTNIDSMETNTPLPVAGERTVLDTDITGLTHDTSDDILYADDFDYSSQMVPVIGPEATILGMEDFVQSRGGDQSVLPRYTSDRNGAFEAAFVNSEWVLRQQVDESLMGLGATWNSGSPITAIGDLRWLNYRASVDVSFEHNSIEGGDNYAGIGARQQGGENSHYTAGTPYLFKYFYDGGWQLQIDGVTTLSGNVVSGTGGTTIPGFNATYNAWHNIAIDVVGSQVTAYLDGTEVATYIDPEPRLSGRVDLASGYYQTLYDNLLVETIPGEPSYYNELLDNLEMHDRSDPPLPKLVYGGAWAHRNGQSMYHYHRSVSTSQGTGSTLSYTFTGTGIDILGPNNGSATLEVTVDGNVDSESAATMASGVLYQTYTLRGLTPGDHTVQFKVLSGTLVVDSVGVVP